MPRRRHQTSRPRHKTPSAPTIYRFAWLHADSSQYMASALARMPDSVRVRDQPAIDRIQATETVEQLLNLVGESTGLAEEAWLNRMRRFGLGTAGPMGERLRQSAALDDPDLRVLTQERLIAALRRCGTPGALVLVDCWETLSPYGKGLACAALGQLRYGPAADRIWAFYEQAVTDRRSTHFVGALWGLVDLGDPRVPGALLELLQSGEWFYELWGFIALAGDAPLVVPLVAYADRLPKDQRLDVLLGAAAVAHRTGREALPIAILASVEGAPDAETTASAGRIADDLLAVPMQVITDHFGLFYPPSATPAS